MSTPILSRVRAHEGWVAAGAIVAGVLALRWWQGRNLVVAPSAKPRPPTAVSQQIAADPIVASPGSYAVVVVTHGAANAASASDVKIYAQGLGFTAVNASSSRPAGFPGTTQGDWYVTATWPGPGQSAPLSRSKGSALAGGNVVDAWRTA